MIVESQAVRPGTVEVTAKIRTDPLTENYHQAGLRVYAGDNDWADYFYTAH